MRSRLKSLGLKFILMVCFILGSGTSLKAQLAYTHGIFVSVDCYCNSGGVENEGSGNAIKAQLFYKDVPNDWDFSTMKKSSLSAKTQEENSYNGKWYDIPADSEGGNDGNPDDALNDCNNYGDGRIQINTAGKGYAYWLYLETTGSDGFMIDEMIISATWGGIVDGCDSNEDCVNYGVDNGFGWCLSTDPNDGKGDWEDNCEGCHKGLWFKLDGKVYPGK